MNTTVTITTIARRITRTANAHAGRGERLGFDVDGTLLAIFPAGVHQDSGYNVDDVTYLVGAPAGGITQREAQVIIDTTDQARAAGHPAHIVQELVGHALRDADQ